MKTSPVDQRKTCIDLLKTLLLGALLCSTLFSYGQTPFTVNFTDNSSGGTITEGDQITYTAQVSGLTESCRVYSWSQNGGIVIGASNQPDFVVQWQQTGSVTLTVWSNGLGGSQDPMFQGLDNCSAGNSQTAQQSVTVVPLCSAELPLRMNCALGYVIAGPIDLNEYLWGDGYTESTRLVKPGDIVEIVDKNPPCSDRRFSFEVTEEKFLQSCSECREAYIEICNPVSN
ncbi:MAG: hypothetical protein AAFO69_01680 [Bacteroidota bacterium]